MNSFCQSTVGKKIIVAATGLILFGFVIVHLIGNLQVFLGPVKLNAYSDLLKREPLLLWAARLVLLASVFLHALFTIQLTRLNRASRPHSYEQYEPTKAGVASRTMIWGGLFLILFIVFHLLHLTTGSTHPHFDPHNVYANIISGFSVWYVSLFYILGQFALGMHLYHGVFSVFQTLGLAHPAYKCWRRRLATAAGVLIPAGYISIPLAVLFKVIQ